LFYINHILTFPFFKLGDENELDDGITLDSSRATNSSLQQNTSESSSRGNDSESPSYRNDLESPLHRGTSESSLINRFDFHSSQRKKIRGGDNDLSPRVVIDTDDDDVVVVSILHSF